MRIPITKTVFDSDELEMVQKPLTSGWVVQGPYVQEFEERFCRYTGADHAVATTSCTTALHIALAALDLNPGDEVIVPAFTWIATANVVEYMGATPIFCDIDPATFNIDPEHARQCVTPKTKGIIPVHLFGLPADMRAIMQLAEQQGLWVVEDAACGFGASLDGQHVGTFGQFGCFSFHPRKAISTGEGGMITTASAEFDALCRSLRDHGASRTDLARHNSKAAFLLSEFNHLGYNYRMTDIQGAIGVAQMKKAAAIQVARCSRAARYYDLLESAEWLRLPHVPEGMVHGFQSFVCWFVPEDVRPENLERIHTLRNSLMLELEERGISTRQGTHAVTLQRYYQQKYGIGETTFPNAVMADRLSITLPLYAQMSDEEQDFVVATICQVFNELHRSPTSSSLT